MGRRIASESKQTVRGGPKPAKVGLHRRLRLMGLRPSDGCLIFPNPASVTPRNGDIL